MNRTIHAGAVGLGVLGVALLVWGWTHREPFTCGDETCQEAHP